MLKTYLGGGDNFLGKFDVEPDHIIEVFHAAIGHALDAAQDGVAVLRYFSLGGQLFRLPHLGKKIPSSRDRRSEQAIVFGVAL